jgi:hypothetical protein
MLYTCHMAAELGIQPSFTGSGKAFTIFPDGTAENAK